MQVPHRRYAAYSPPEIENADFCVKSSNEQRRHQRLRLPNRLWPQRKPEKSKFNDFWRKELRPKNFVEKTVCVLFLLQFRPINFHEKEGVKECEFM